MKNSITVLIADDYPLFRKGSREVLSVDLTSKEIAERLGISAHTVENHRAKICERLNLHGSHSLLKFAYDNKSRL